MAGDWVVDEIVLEVLGIANCSEYFLLSDSFVFFKIRQQDVVAHDSEDVGDWILVFDEHPELAHGTRVE